MTVTVSLPKGVVRGVLMEFRRQFTTKEWLILQASPIWVGFLVAAADGHADPKEIDENLRQTIRAATFSTGFTKEVFEDHVYMHLNEDDALSAVVETLDPLEGLKAVSILLGKIPSSEAENFKDTLRNMAFKIALVSDGIDKNEEAAIKLIDLILDGAI